MATYRKNQVLPAGEYDAKVVAAEEKRSKNGNEMIVVKVRVQFGGEARYVRDYLLLTGGGNWKFDSFQAAVGKQSCVDGQTVEPDDYVGCLARVVVKVDSYNGEPQNKITKWLPRKASADAPLVAPTKADPTRGEANSPVAQPSKALPSARTAFSSGSDSAGGKS